MWERVLVFVLGGGLVLIALLSAIRTLVMPRGASDQIVRAVFIVTRRILEKFLPRNASYYQRDNILAIWAPIALLSLVPAWMSLILIGYAGMYWSVQPTSWYDALRVSGSSLLTLGFAPPNGFAVTLLEFSEATIGLIIVALLIAYLPTIYGGFSRREIAVTTLEVRAGSPPSAVEMLKRYHRIHGMERLVDVWKNWELWFADVEESHTSLPALVFMRSQEPDRSWVTSAGAVLDAAALSQSVLDLPKNPDAMLCIRAGYLCLNRISRFFEIDLPKEPHFPETPIQISRQEFDAACLELERVGISLLEDRDQAWLDFAGWRVNYDHALVTLAGIVSAPSAPWSADRAPTMRATIFRNIQRKG